MRYRGMVLFLASFLSAAPAVAQVGPEGFAAWLDSFRTRAAAAGIASEVTDRALTGIAYNSTVIEKDRYQPEFVRPIWEYLGKAVSSRKVEEGQALAQKHAALLAVLESQYGVPSSVLMAIWGIESAYGSAFGNFGVFEALATLAYDGRRGEFWEGELLAALRILQSEELSPERMRGSWAGAMGHTQFLPSSFLGYAVDGDGDGVRDIWADNPADALASSANYLAEHGWRRGMPWGQEAMLPDSFDYTLVDGAVRRPLRQWRELDVRAADGGPLPDSLDLDWKAAVIAPAGSEGPAFLLLDNFRVLLRYNNSTSYALAVSRLADRIEGGGPLSGRWPGGEPSLRVERIERMQEQLIRLGYGDLGVDGIVGPQTRKAVRSFQQKLGLVPDGFVSNALLEAVEAAANP